MPPSNHDTLVYRLAQILIKLNQGEKLVPQNLADEFGINLRTIQRDLNERFAYLPMQKAEGRYFLDPAYLGKLSTKDIERFANLAGVGGLFPSLSDRFLRNILDAGIQSTLLVKGHNYEDLGDKASLFGELEQAIISHCHVSFSYKKYEREKQYQSVAPYKLMNHKGVWYLAAQDGEKLKTFAFGRIERLRALENHFTPDPAMERLLIEEEGIWFNEEKREIILKVTKEVAGYFERRKLIANQKVEKVLEDGGLIVSTKVGHPNQILPIVRYWIPHIRIISPEHLQQEMEIGLVEYMKRTFE